MELTEKELHEAFSRVKIPERIRLFMITDKMYVRIYKGKATWKLQEEEFGIVKKLGCERGEILDLFSKMEFLVNELIQLRVLGPNSENAEKMDDILSGLDLFGRVKLLKRWGMLDNKHAEMLNQARQARNGFAHAWGTEEVLYKEKPIEKTFPQFKKDMEEIWEALVAAYSLEQKKYDISGIFEEIRKHNEKKK